MPTPFLLKTLLLAALAPAPGGLRLASPEQLRTVPLAAMPYSGVELPEAVDLSPDMPPPGDQGRQNSCVGWATAYALKSYQERLEQNYALSRPDGSPDPQRVFSPAFVYNLLNNGRDGGVTYIDALNLLSAQGALPWREMPYNPDDYRRKPRPEQLAQARPWRIETWRQVNVLDLRELKAHLNAGYPILAGALIDQGFYQAQRGHVWRSRRGKVLGGHALVIVGYSDNRRAFKVLNSWGPRWADGGFGWIDYAWFPRVIREGFVARDALNTPPPPVEDRTLSKPERLAPAPSQRPAPMAAADSLPGLTLAGVLRIPARTERAQVVVQVYARRLGERSLLLSQWPVTEVPVQPEHHWHLTLPLAQLGLEGHPLSGTGQPLELEVQAHLFSHGFGVASGPPQRLSLPPWHGSGRDADQTRGAFVVAWERQHYARLWQMLSEPARRQAFAELSDRLSGERFTPEQVRLLLEQGHPLTGILLWSAHDPRQQRWPLIETATGWRVDWP